MEWVILELLVFFSYFEIGPLLIGKTLSDKWDFSGNGLDSIMLKSTVIHKTTWCNEIYFHFLIRIDSSFGKYLPLT